jgi:amino acid adenylation domain-containing protein
MRAVDVIGLSCRLPGAPSYDEFWALLEKQGQPTRRVDGVRWDAAAQGAGASDFGGLLDHIDRFDHGFFGISAREARSMDPQQRLLLEEAWRCLEDAGVPHEELRSRVTAVYASAMTIDYHQNVTAPGTPVDSYACLGNYIGILANRLSHVFGWRGESYTLDAACAGSLTALHQARRALLAGECDYALVAGVSLILNPWHYLSFGKSRMLSPEGRCKTFDRDADGYAPGEGVVVALLCREAEAARNHCRVHGRISGTATGHVGPSRGITAPSVDAQRRVIEAAAAAAGVGLETLSYVEAHGTGTPLGDPVEIAALGAALSAAGPRSEPCRVGSVKTNIGHLEAAAGLASVAKVLLMMRHRRIVAGLRLEAVNPLIDFESGPLRPAIRAEPWRAEILRAGVSAFGFGGAVAHAIVEEPPPAPPAALDGATRFPFLLSAASLPSFRALWEAWRGFVASPAFAAAALRDILGTLACGRAPLAFRWACVVESKAQLAQLFAAPAPEPARGVAPHVLAELGEDRDRGLSRLALLRSLGLRSLVVACDGERPDAAALSSWPRYDRSARRLRLPVALDAAYLAVLREGLALPDPARRGRLMQRARDLLHSNFSFRACLEEWRRIAGVDLAAWLDAPPQREDDVRLLLLATAAAHRRILARWRLPEARETAGEAFDEVAALVVDGLLTEREAIALLGSDPLDALAERLCLRAAFRSAPDLPILRRESEGRRGEVAIDAPPADLVLRLDAGSETELLASLWRAGAGLDWRALGESYRVTSLPLYPFAGERHWIDLPRPQEGAPPAPGASLDDYAAYRLFIALDRAGALTPLGAGLSCEDMARRCLGATGRGADLDAALEALARRGLVALENGRARALATPREAAKAAHELRERLAADAAHLPVIEAVDACMAELPRVLAGEGAAAPEIVERLLRPPPGGAAATPLPLAGNGRSNAHRLASTTSWPGLSRPSTPMGRGFPDALGDVDVPPSSAGLCRDVARFEPSSMDGGSVPHISRLLGVDGRDKPGHDGAGADGETLAQVRRIVAECAGLGEEPIADDALLADIGIDSLAAGDVAERLGAALGRRIPSHVVDDHPTIARLARHLTADTSVDALPSPSGGGSGRHSPALATGVLSERPTAVRGGVGPRDSGSTPSLPPSAVDLPPPGGGGRASFGLSALDAIGASPSPSGGGSGREADRGGVAQRPPIDRIRDIVARVAQCDPASVAEDARFADIGVDSLAAGDLAQLLGEALGRRISPHVVDDHPTLARLCAFLVESGADAPAPADLGVTREWRLAAPGDLASLEPVEIARRALAPDEVEVEVAAAGLNFRDVMEGLGRLGGAPRPLGLEFAGRVSRLGAGVSDLEIGASVVGVAIGALGRHVVARRRFIVEKPAALSFAQAAAAPIVFLTAVWSLEEIARLREGQSVLIHAGTGGVGLAAIQLAHAAGATVIATAGSEEKRDHLRRLGVAHIGDSRSLAFVETARRATGGRGVDVLLNCLAGPLTDAGLDLVAPGGVFIELGKTDIRGAEEIARRRPDIRYEVFDLLAEIDERPEGVGERLRAMMRRFAPGGLEAPPLAPFAFEEAPAALRHLARARHIGKVVLTDRPAAEAPRVDASDGDDRIAIVAMSGRFPGASDLPALWRLLREGREAIGAAPAGRWRAEEFAARGVEPGDEPRLRAGGFLDEADAFDAGFFGVSPREALAMDPQQRLLLEEAWVALAAAGMAPRGEADPRVGVFVGASASDYDVKTALLGLPQDRPSLLGTMPSSLAARISYAFDFAGPALTVDTGCTSAVTALKLAVEALERGEIDAALVASVAVRCTPQLALQAARAEILAPDGRCRSFGGGEGLGLSEGVGALVLKRLSDALAPPDRVLAVLRAVGVRQNGATRGMSAPSVAAQTALARETLARAGVDPADVSYVEAHGVGTKSGDAAEASALAAVFGSGAPLPVGSAKSNIGHALAVAGMAGLFKTVLQMRHGQLAPTLHAQAEPPEFAGSRLTLNRCLTPWTAPRGKPRRALIQAFGVNGGNGAILLEEAPATRAGATCETPLLILTAAASQASLRARLEALADWLGEERVALTDLACSLNAELDALPANARKFRAAFVARSCDELRAQIVESSMQDRIREARRHESDMQRIYSGVAEQLCREGKLESAAKIFMDGVDFRAPEPIGARRLAFLPPFRFERQTFWPGAEAPAAPAPYPLVLRSPRSGRLEGRPREDSDEFRPVAVLRDAACGGPSGRGFEEAIAPEPGEDRRLILLREAAAEVLAQPLSRLRADATLPSLGLDSLLALELRRRLLRVFGAAPDTSALLSRTPLADLAAALPQSEAPVVPATIAVDPSARFEPFPLTDIQMAYWLGRGGGYALSGACQVYWEFTGAADRDPARLEAAFDRLVALHDMLRAVVSADGTQRILPSVPRYVIERHDFRGDGDGLAALREAMSQETFDPARWPLFHVAFSRDDEVSRLHLSVDLLIIDVPSLALLIGQWARLEREPGAQPEPPTIAFRDYVLHRKREETSAAYEEARAYWAKEGAALPPAPRLAGMKPLDALPTPQWRRLRGGLDAKLRRALETRAAEQGVTLVAVLVTALAEVLAHWAEERRFTLNLTVNDRDAPHPDIARVVGDFTSTILLGLDLESDTPFAARLESAAGMLARHLAHSRFSGVKVLQQRGLRGEDQLIPVVFTSMLGYGPLSGPLGRLDFGATRTPQVWLDAQAMDDEGALVLTFDAVDGFFPSGMLDAIFATWREALAALAREDALWRRPLGDWIGERERKWRETRNATASPAPQGLLHEPFVGRALAHPERIAVIAAGEEISYGRLLAQATAAAEALGPRAPDRLVAIGMSKGWRQIAAAIGVLIAGGAYLPIDPALPEERSRRLLAAGEVDTIVTSADLATRWPRELRAIAVDALAPSTRAGAKLGEARPDHLAYVIFTSGSTGEPKGVMIEHRAALNTIVDIDERFRVGPDDRVLGLSDLGFDLSVYDIFGVLGAGGALVLPESRSAQDPDHLARLVLDHGVTLWNAVPSFMQLFLTSARAEAALRRLRLVMMSGDWIPLDLPPRLRAANPNIEIVSLGGATEASIWSILYPIGALDASWSSVPYGYPMRNQRFHVLDADLDDRPDHVAGELYIAGDGLARGYWRDEARTAERFIRHPRTGERLYRTGDLGRYREEGLIEFLGRADGQVKIGGYRIELGEIEAALARHPAIAQCVVVARADETGRKSLVAAFVPRRGEALDAPTLRAFLSWTLPAYMIPAIYEPRDTLPRNGNDKIDRKALARPEAEPAPARAAPSADMEPRMLAIWREVLGNRDLRADDKLFEHGAHSFHAVDANLRINRELALACTVTDIFEFPTARSLAAALLARSGAPAPIVEPEPEAIAQPKRAASRGDRRRRFRAMAQ